MELVDGVPITRYCREQRSSIDDRLRLFRAVCEAVQHAHQQAVIHRDLKPSNILVTRDGRVKLLDFGISKRLDDTLVGAEDLTRDGLRFMTPAYAAPEQLRAGRTAMDTDVYSLGVVLYELLAGRPPFQLGERTPSKIVDRPHRKDVENGHTSAATSEASERRRQRRVRDTQPVGRSRRAGAHGHAPRRGPALPPRRIVGARRRPLLQG